MVISFEEKDRAAIEKSILKPCPFCGGEAYFRTPQKDKGTAMCSVSVECKKCGAMPYVTLVYEFLSDTEKKEAAAKAWNRRT